MYADNLPREVRRWHNSYGFYMDLGLRHTVLANLILPQYQPLLRCTQLHKFEFEFDQRQPVGFCACR